jgi:hypothetical protein
MSRGLLERLEDLYRQFPSTDLADAIRRMREVHDDLPSGGQSPLTGNADSQPDAAAKVAGGRRPASTGVRVVRPRPGLREAWPR